MPENVRDDIQNDGRRDTHAAEQAGDGGFTAPFVVEHRQEERTARGYFRPVSRLILTPALRTSGLWHILPGEEMKSLILMLTFLTPNGWCRPTLLELSEAMQVSQGKAKSRMERLATLEWQGQPLVSRLDRPDGLDAFVPGRALVAHEEVAPEEPPQPVTSGVGNRGAVIAHSRSRYAKTREEVERQISEMMGWAPPAFEGEDSAIAEGKRLAYQAMTALGVPKDQALDLLERFPLEAVERQLAWLPSRHAKTPARFLVAAIEGDYEMPPAVRRQEIISAALREQEQRNAAQSTEASMNPAAIGEITTVEGAGEELPSPVNNKP